MYMDVFRLGDSYYIKWFVFQGIRLLFIVPNLERLQFYLCQYNNYLEMI